MKLAEEILINQYGQGIVSIENILKILFNGLTLDEKRTLLSDILYMIMQSKPEDEDIEVAITASKLKPTYTPCVLLRKGVAMHHLQVIVNLPEPELGKGFILLLSLFKIAYQRRYEAEKQFKGKWWYWDLSDPKNIEKLERAITTNDYTIL